MTERVIVRKLDAEGGEVIRYPGQVVRQTENSLVLEAFYEMEDIEFPGLTFRRGDRFLETHYRNRWYNVLAIHDVDSGLLKGWYCNLARPATIEDGFVSAEDLALDLVVQLDGTWHVLDEDEFANLKLDEADRTKVESALEELKRYAESLAGPFVIDVEGL